MEGEWEDCIFFSDPKALSIIENFLARARRNFRWRMVSACLRVRIQIVIHTVSSFEKAW